MKPDQIKEWSHFFLTYKFALDEVETKLNILNEEFQFIHDYNPIEHMKTRIKTPESLMTKLRRKGLDISLDAAKHHIRDIAGVRVICSFSTDIYHIVEMISMQNDVRIIEVKDYVKNPKPNGYQSVHLIIEIPVFLTNRTEHICVEIQIRTIAMDFWASLEHKIYYKFDERVPEHIQQQLKGSAAMIDTLDRQMLELNEEVQRHRAQAHE
ncbi:GTP pyrophosphokinase [Paenibacillus harenae]|uniref:GTP pyrophosphokinase n=1 Tax=Paenibacillus harenae TaxID=306543 RepID=A0ABT9TX82_PAEHA|nr:GTP pyrophosphokinase family protein [Paenibacillus harenae]MDQ0111687.1 putative GTP pyrophosphokinase [Paenibacillus harenae]